MRSSAAAWHVRWRSRCARPDAGAARRLSARRDELLRRCLSLGARLYEGNLAKVYSGELSPGCRSCARGDWSYIEISQFCQGRCFYCPRPQKSPSRPFERMLALPFDSPERYAEAVLRLGFRGVGLSGGEPLLSMERTEAFLRALRRAGGDSLYLWVYTNGLLADDRRLRRLRDCGVDEVRFDISAADYDVSAVRRAVKIVPAVTVEIPAIPEDANRLAGLLDELAEAGVRYMNLHQLTVTPFNDGPLSRRGYTVVDNGPLASPSVIESELAALSLLERSLERRVPLPINYCSFVYKRRFHARIRRSRLAGHFAAEDPFAAVTAAGWLRRLWVTAPPREAADLARRIPSQARLRSVRGGRTLVLVTPEALSSPALRGRAVTAAYFEHERSPAARVGEEAPLRLRCAGDFGYREAFSARRSLTRDEDRRLFAREFLVPPAERSLAPARVRADFRARFKGLEFLSPDPHSYAGEARAASRSQVSAAAQNSSPQWK